jgi:prophage antirepressor-like protein
MNNKRFFTLETESRNKYYQIPKVFMLKESKYSSLSPMAKLTYGILADRNSISIENGWIDDEQRVFFLFNQEDLCETLGISQPKTLRKYLKELESMDLIFTVRQGLNLPNKLYLLQVEVSESQSYQLIGKKHPSRRAKNTYQEGQKIPTNKTNINKTNINKTNKSSSNEKVEEEEIESDIDLILRETSKINLKLSRKVTEQLLLGYNLKEILRVIAAISNPSEIKNAGAYVRKALVENSKTTEVKVTNNITNELKGNGNFKGRDYDQAFYDDLKDSDDFWI